MHVCIWRVFLGAKATMNRNKPIAEVVDKHLEGDNQGNRISAAIAGRRAMVDFDRKRKALVEAERVRKSKQLLIDQQNRDKRRAKYALKIQQITVVGVLWTRARTATPFFTHSRPSPRSIMLENQNLRHAKST